MTGAQLYSYGLYAFFCLRNDLHVSGVAEIYATLIGHFVCAVLQTYDLLSLSQLLFGKLSLVAFRFARSKSWQSIFLRFAAKRMQTQAHLMHILAVPQVYCLKRFGINETVVFTCSREHFDVLHELESQCTTVDFFNLVRLQLVYKPFWCKRKHFLKIQFVIIFIYIFDDYEHKIIIIFLFS